MEDAEVAHRAREFLRQVGAVPVGEDLSPYAKALGAKIKFDELDKGESGYTLTRASGKHVITINALESPQRQRFTICHEIAHIALELPSDHKEVAPWAFAKRHINEVHCDLFAAELLMPYQQWLAIVSKGEPSLDAIKTMAATFCTSYPATASRFATLSDGPCAFVTMERGTVRYAAQSKTLRALNARIRARSPIPEGALAHRLRAAKETQTQTADVAQDVWFEDWEAGLELVELSRHYAESDTTTSLLWFDNEDAPEIEVDRFGRQTREETGLDELTGHLEWGSRSRRR
ncbi:hypothetical protein BEN78_14785 [Xanthomonas citri pv. mangiferaeindicae]|nr:hypothetical protein BEN78_14785 [Xanthomonas citri pv. mangiferaeindicae]